MVGVNDASVRLWLDDVRPAPEGWTWVKTAREAIALLAQGDVTVCSLDHDLGAEESGYDVLLWIEACMAAGAWYGALPEFHIHSANPVGRERMMAALRSITILHREWQEAVA